MLIFNLYSFLEESEFGAAGTAAPKFTLIQKT